MNQSAFFQSIKPFYTSRIAIWSIIGFGVICRLAQFITNRSLARDEAATAINLVRRSFLELLKPLSNFQSNSYGFLWIEKFFVTIFGANEYAMRLFPLICGIAAIFIFYKLVSRVLDKNTMPLALLLFVAASGPNYYSVDVKQYASDIAIAGLLLLTGLNYPERHWLFALTGAIAVWISPPATFILASVGMSLCIAALLKREWRQIGRLFSIFAVWLASFVIYYKLHLEYVVDKELEKTWGYLNAFAPLPPRNLQDLKWYLDVAVGIFWHPRTLGYSRFGSIAVVITLTGAASLYKRNKTTFFTLTLPILLALLASGMHKYLFKDRVILFLMPSVLILLAEGFYALGVWLNKLWRPLLFTNIVFIVLFLYFPLRNTSFCIGGISRAHKWMPSGYQEIKELLEYLSERYQKGDKVLVHPWARDCFWYYTMAMGYKFDYKICDTINNKDILDRKVNEDEDMIKEIDALAGNKRVWFLFARSDDPGGSVEKCLKHLEQNWHKIEEREEPGAYLCLYDVR